MKECQEPPPAVTLPVEEIALGGPNSHNPLEARFLLIALQEYHASTAAPLLPWQVDKHAQEIVDHVSSLTGYVSLYVQTTMLSMPGYK